MERDVSPRSAARRLLAGVAASAALVLLTGCQSSTAGHGTAEGAGPPAATSSGASGSESNSTSGGAPGPTVELHRTAWYGGFQVNIESGAIVKDKDTGKPQVQLTTTFVNDGDDLARFDYSSLDLASGGNHYQAGFDLEGIPDVPGKASGHGRLSFDVDEKFTFADAVLTLGSSDYQQAVLPLGGSGEAKPNKPVTVPLTGATTSDQIRAQITGGEIRADLPRRHRQSRAGSVSLKIVVNVTAVRTGAGGYPLSQNNFALSLPDGSQVAPDDQDKMITLLSLNETLTGGILWFTIPAPAGGRYLLLVTDDFRAGKPRLTTAINVIIPKQT